MKINNNVGEPGFNSFNGTVNNLCREVIKHQCGNCKYFDSDSTIGVGSVALIGECTSPLPEWIYDLHGALKNHICFDDRVMEYSGGKNCKLFIEKEK